MENLEWRIKKNFEVRRQNLELVKKTSGSPHE